LELVVFVLKADDLYFYHSVSNLQGKSRLHYSMVFYIVLRPSFLDLDKDTDSFPSKQPAMETIETLDTSSVNS
jgi:hypothetical protein